MTLAQPAVHATRPKHSLIFAACIAAGATFAAGCAGTPEPTEQLVAARQALTAAEQAQAVEHAADLMTESRTKLGLAEAAVKDDEMERAARLAAVASSALMLAACASAPSAPAGAAAVRAELTRLQSDSKLATRAPKAIHDAELAVAAAEQPQCGDTDADAAHRVYMAGRKVALARALATARLAEDQRPLLAQQRDEVRLTARTEEAVAARAATTVAQLESADLQREIEALRARPTDQGLVLTLGDIPFTTGRADLKPGALADVDRLVAFLNKYPERTVTIEGHTDSVGSAASNETLSHNRADAVQSYLMQRGIDASRIQTRGMGETVTVASNATPGGRQQNRRVEIIVSNPPRQASVM